MPKLKATHINVTNEEDAATTAAAMSDPDALPLTDEQWAHAVPLVRIGRPKAEATKQATTIRLSPNVMAAFKATGSLQGVAN
jgi:uncharacterized protein (DUF4415 family)